MSCDRIYLIVLNSKLIIMIFQLDITVVAIVVNPLLAFSIQWLNALQVAIYVCIINKYIYVGRLGCVSYGQTGCVRISLTGSIGHVSYVVIYNYSFSCCCGGNYMLVLKWILQ